MKRLVTLSRVSQSPLRSLQRRPQVAFLSNKTPVLDTPEATFTQAIPLGPYYDSVLNRPQPIPDEKPEDPPASANVEPTSEQEETNTTADKPKSPRGRKPKEDKPAAPSKPTSKQKAAAASPPPPIETSPPISTPPPASAQAQARVVFGSRLLGPAERAERLADMRSRSSLVAGVLVPPRPEEPDNCCMSGCVNCVWDRFRDETEVWAGAHKEAERRLRAQEAGATGAATKPPPVGAGGAVPSDRPAASMDDDGGGSETNWDGAAADGKLVKDFWDEDLYKNLPVGIREFMKQEKKLKLKHEREGTVGG